MLAALLADVPREKIRTIDMLVDLNQRVQKLVAYIVRMEPGVWTPEHTLAEKKGSCRDSAWLLVHVLRHLGFAARFVSGYLIQLVADQKPLEGPEGPTSDFTDLHAWAEVYLPGAGWIGLDATSGLLAGEGHIPLAASPDPMSAAPISGGVEQAEVAFDVEMKVARVFESPRVTKPYSEAQWRSILAAGHRVDQALEEGHVRLTMGGEPTFVSATDMDGAEWNVDALGPTKRGYAGRLLRKLLPLWSPGAAITHALGKHYPGEQLPRWALNAHWRRDGEAVWRDIGLLASDDDHGTANAATAQKFCEALAERLQVPPSLINPAYEDIHYYLWKENRLPANVLAEDSKLKDPLARDRMARVFGQGLNATIGSVLPLRRVAANGTRRWQSGKWFFKPGVLFLIPGDAPIGYRLPLESLPWADPARIEYDFERDPFAAEEKLPPRQSYRRVVSDPSGAAGPGHGYYGDLARGPGLVPQSLPEIGREEPNLVRTALTVEARGGKLHIFFPPLYAAEDWLDLAAAIEDTAEEFHLQVVLEGYQPPRDPRLNQFSVTPDPGVIEVNVHPAENFTEMVERTTQLYEVARETGLATQNSCSMDGMSAPAAATMW